MRHPSVVRAPLQPLPGADSGSGIEADSARQGKIADLVPMELAMSTENPWKRLSGQTVYENPWIEVREDQVIRPDGKPGIYGVVHYRNKAVGVLPVDDDGCVYLVGQYRYTLNRYSWEIPEGGCPEGEDPLEGAKRELREETGLEAAQWRVLGTAHLSNSVSDEEAILYLATKLIQGEPEPEGTEALQQMLIPFESALNMVRLGEITDAMSVMALQSYAILKQRGEVFPDALSRLP